MGHTALRHKTRLAPYHSLIKICLNSQEAEPHSSAALKSFQKSDFSSLISAVAFLGKDSIVLDVENAFNQFYF